MDSGSHRLDEAASGSSRGGLKEADALGTRGLPRFELVLMLIVLFVLQGVLTSQTMMQRMTWSLLYLGLMGSALRSLAPSRWCLWIGMASGLSAILVSLVSEWWEPQTGLTVVYGGYAGMFVCLIWALSQRVFAAGPVDSDRILGAVSIYLVAGWLWAFVYALLEVWRPGSFVGLTEDPARLGTELVGELMYFSFVTLTTLGYGDVTPGRELARNLAVLQAVFGQLYLAVVVARLVGLHKGRLGS